MALEDIEKKLYKIGKEGEAEKEEDVFQKQPIFEKAADWRKEIESGAAVFKKPSEPQKDFYKKRKKPFFLYAIAGVLVLVLIIEGFSVAKKFFSKEAGLNISFSAPEEIFAADPFDLRINYENNSPNLLQDAVLVLELPINVKSLADESESGFVRRILGNLGTGTDSGQEFKLVALTEPNQILQIKASLQYSLPGFSSRFSKDIVENIAVSGPAIGFNLILPQAVVAGDEFVFQIDYFNNTNKPISNLRMDLSYPLGFEFLSSDLSPQEKKNVWVIEELSAKQSGSLKIFGQVSGQPGSFFEFKTDLAMFSQNQKINLGRKTAGLTVSDSPLRLKISLSNKSQNYIAKPGEDLEYKIEYFNNTAIGLEEAILKVALDGEMFDFSLADTKGYFDSATRRIIFNAGNTEGLRLVNRGQGGEAIFKIGVKEGYPIERMNDKNFVLKIKADLESLSVPPGSDLEKTTASSEFETKVAGQTNVLAKALFRDAASGIVNKGQLPLKVGQTANLTIHLKLVNYANDLSDISLKTVLPQGVSWTNQIAGNYGGDLPEYNERTGELIWNIASLPATSGVILPAKELIFQVAIKPSLNQIGQYVKILGEVSFSAQDDFTGENISFVTNGLDSSLRDDPTIKNDEGRVRP